VSNPVSINLSTLTQGPTTTSYVPSPATGAYGIVSGNNGQQGQSIDINNTRDQIQMTATLATNGARVDSVVAYVANADGTSRTSVGSQSFPSAAASGPVSLYINTADFTANFTAGTAAAKFANGQKQISVSAFSGATELKSTNSQTVNFNNVDGYAIRATAPAKSATSATGVVYFGGPGATGTGTATIMPVFYTAGRTPTTVTVSMRQGAGGATQACSEFLVFSAGPYTAKFGSASAVALDTTVIDCSGVSSADDHVIGVSAGTDNAGNALPLVSYAGGFRTSTTITAPTAIRLDYAAPTITRYSVKGYAGNADSAWVNGTASIMGGFNATTGAPLRYEAADAAGGVGFASTTSARDVTVKVCVTPSSIATDAPTNCTSPVKTGSITSTIASMGLGENADNLSNGAYFAQVAERDLLGNEATSVSFAHTLPATATAAALPVTATPGPLNVTIAAGTSAGQFGVDVTAPVNATIPTAAQALASTTTNASVAGNIMGFTDAILSTAGLTDSTTSDTKNASNAVFVVRVTDSRSGFATCTTVNCFAASGVNAGTYQITRTFANSTPGNTSAIVENLVNTSTTAGPANANVMNASAVTGMANTYDFKMAVFGAANRILPTGNAGAPTTQTGDVGNEGYYAFAATLTDRAGNTSAAPITKRVLIVNSAPTSVTVAVPTALTGGASVSFNVSSSSTTEVVAGELQLTYASLGTGGVSSGSPNIRYPRVAAGGIAATSGVIHAPFAFDGKMSSQTGEAGYALTLTIPQFISTIQVAAGGVPAAPSSTVTPTKPATITVTAFDPRALATVTGRTGGYPTNAQGALGNASGASGSTAIDPARVSGSATVTKNWTSTATATDPGAGIDLWSLNATLSTATTVVFEATTAATVVSNPFPGGVAVIRRRYNAVSTAQTMTDEQDYIGMAGPASMTVSNSGTRTWRYSVTPTAVVQGNAVTRAGYAANDEIRAIGLDAAGNGLATDRTPATAGVVSYVLTTAAGEVPKQLVPAGGSLWQTWVRAGTSTLGGQTSSALVNQNLSEGSLPTDPVVLQTSGATLVITGGTAVLGYGAGAVGYSCISSDAAVATVVTSGKTCTVTAAGAGTATIWNVATATAAGATTASTKLITTHVEVRAAETHTGTGTGTAAYATSTHGLWTTVDAISSAGYLSRSQKLTMLLPMGGTVVAGATASNVQNLCSVTGSNATVASSTLIDNKATCVLTRSTPSAAGTNAAVVSSTAGTVTTTGGNQVTETFTFYQYYRVSMPGQQRYSLPINRLVTAVPIPNTVPTLVSVTSAPTTLATTEDVELATPVSLIVYDQHGLTVNGGKVDIICSNAKYALTAGATPLACTSAVTLPASATGVITFYVIPGTAGTASTVTVSKLASTDPIYFSTLTNIAKIIPGTTPTTLALTGTPVAATSPAGSGTVTHNGAANTYIPNAGSYSFSMAGLTAAAGGAAVYTCTLWDAATAGTAIASSVNIATVTGTSCAIAAVSVLAADADIYVQVGGGVTGPGLLAYTATAPARFKVIRTVAAGLGTLTNTGTFPRNMTDAGQPYSFTMSGITAHSGAGYVYGCEGYTANPGVNVSTLITATTTVANGVYTCTLTPNGINGTTATPVYIKLTGSALNTAAGLTAFTATPVYVTVNRIP
jgi:hypothetical protein